MDEAITVLAGCVDILKDIDGTDPRIWTVIAAIQWAKETLELIDEPDLAGKAN